MPSIRPLGDSAAIVRWTGADDGEICRAVRQTAAALSHNHAEENGFEPESVVSGFQSVTVHFRPGRVSFSDMARIIENAMLRAETCRAVTSHCIEIPVCFVAQFALDLAEVAGAHGLNSDELIRRFCDAEYFVRMIGFSPGFPYLSGLPEQLTTPRRSSPRLKVPQGSVAIGGRQAGIYSQESPGGWNIIGRTPVRLFREELSQPCLLMAGDQVRFLPIRAEEFHKWQDEQ